jgi:hypothetical protein
VPKILRAFFFFFFFFFFSAGLLLLSGSCAQAQIKKGRVADVALDGYFLTQRGPSFGSTSWQICPDYIKVTSSLLTIIVDVKKDLARIYTLKSGKYMELPVEQAVRRIETFRQRDNYVFTPLKLQSQKQAHGFSSQVYKRAVAFREPPKAKELPVLEDELIITNKLGIPKKLIALIGQVTQIPQNKGFPLEAVRYGYYKSKPARRYVYQMLETVMVHRSKIKKSVFALPSGLVRTNSEVELLKGRSVLSDKDLELFREP